MEVEEWEELGEVLLRPKEKEHRDEGEYEGGPGPP